jgi:hypothetical protein
MPIKIQWDSDTGRRLILFYYIGKWDWVEYETAVAKTVEMMESVSTPVTVIIDLSHSEMNTKTPTAFQYWLDAIKRWQACSSYANFWVVIQPNYWEQITLWAISNIYNPTSMLVAASLEDARMKALKKLSPLIDNAWDEAAKSP